MNSNYAKAYVEILEILKYLPKEEYEKIPKERIKFFADNCDKDYSFKFDISKPLEEQKFLRETNSIIIILFRDYFATQVQKEKLKKILLNNEKIYQEELRKKYNPDNIFEISVKNVNGKDIDKYNDNTKELIEIKDEKLLKKIFNKIISWIKNKL